MQQTHLDEDGGMARPALAGVTLDPLNEDLAALQVRVVQRILGGRGCRWRALGSTRRKPGSG